MKNIELETNISHAFQKVWECGKLLLAGYLGVILIVTDKVHGLIRDVISQDQQALVLEQQTLLSGLDPRALTSAFSSSDNCPHVSFGAKPSLRRDGEGGCDSLGSSGITQHRRSDGGWGF